MKKILASLLFLLTNYALSYESPTGYPFPIDHYDQNIIHWIGKEASASSQLLLDHTMEEVQWDHFKDHYMGRASAWSPALIEVLLHSNIQLELIHNIDNFTNPIAAEKERIAGNSPADIQSHQGRPACKAAIYSQQWAEVIRRNMVIDSYPSDSIKKSYEPSARGIAIDNVSARTLPTKDHYFYDCQLAGEGDSFDYLQIGVLWAGTPVYIIGASQDKKWDLIFNGDYIGWVESNKIAKVEQAFVDQWIKSSSQLVAINQQELPIADEALPSQHFLGFIGQVFPLSKVSSSGGYHILIPEKTSHGPARIGTAFLKKKEAVRMPWSLTPAHFIEVMNHLIGRPYGWGNLNRIHPKRFLNDCSSEIKSLYTPFGIWLPAHSSKQVDETQTIGQSADWSTETGEGRLARLIDMTSGTDHRFVTIVYIGHHVFLYLGAYSNPLDPKKTLIPLTYQNLWGMSPLPGKDNDGKELPSGRLVIGKSALFPLLLNYPEQFPFPFARNVGSHATKKIFQVMRLDKLPVKPLWWQEVIHTSILTQDQLHALMGSDLPI